jgi:hypothetical protein
MRGPTNRRRSARLSLTTLLALVAQAMLVMASPLADARYHERGPLQVEPIGAHGLSHRSGQCPECMALQTLAVPGSQTYVLRSDWAREDAATPRLALGRVAIRSRSKFPRAPPAASPTNR